MNTLDRLGPRICILGPSNSGKSTLAAAIAKQRHLPAVHLDQLFHQPHTNWQARPEAEYLALHEQAVQASEWVMEGNYTRSLPARLAHATGFILLDVSMALSLWRYVRRSCFERQRLGALEGGQDSVKWRMIHHIAIVTPPNRRRYRQIYERLEIPKIKLATRAEIKRFYQEEGLDKTP